MAEHSRVVFGSKTVGSVVTTWGGTAFRKYGDMSDVSSEDNSDISHFPPRWHSPILSFINFYLPWDIQTLFQWIRYFDTWHPLIGSCIDLHTQLPLSRFGLKGIKDTKVLDFYEDVMEEMDAFMVMYDMLREYWLCGEVFTYLNWDDNLGAFTDAELLMPEYVEVVGHPILVGGQDSYRYVLIPDETMIAFVESNDPIAQALKAKLPDGVMEAVRSPERRIAIDPFSLMPLFRKQSRYNLRGTSITLRAFKDLIYESKLQESQFAIADRLVNPKEIWKVGTDKFPATQAKLSNFAGLVRDAEQQPLFNLVVDHTVSYDVIGAVGKYPNLSQELDWVENRVLTALMTNKGMTHGEGPNYQNMSVAARALMMRYMPVRAALEDAWKVNVFLPMAVKHGFYNITSAELAHNVRKPFKDRTPMIPEFDWRYKTNLLDDASYRDAILRLREKGEVPFKLVCDAMNWDYDYVQKWLEEEEGTPHDPMYQEWRKSLRQGGVKVEKAGHLADFPMAARRYAKEFDQTTSDKDKKMWDKGKKGFENDAEKEAKPDPLAMDADFATFGGLKRKKRILVALQRMANEVGKGTTIEDLTSGRVAIPKKYLSVN